MEIIPYAILVFENVAFENHSIQTLFRSEIWRSETIPFENPAFGNYHVQGTTTPAVQKDGTQHAASDPPVGAVVPLEVRDPRASLNRFVLFGVRKKGVRLGNRILWICWYNICLTNAYSNYQVLEGMVNKGKQVNHQHPFQQEQRKRTSHAPIHNTN